VAVSCTGETPTTSKMTMSSPATISSMESGSSQDALDSTHVGLIIAVVVFGCFLLIVCVIIIRNAVRSRRNRRQERTEETMIPMTVTDDTTKYENPASNTLTQTSDDNPYSDLQEAPSALVDGAVGGAGSEDIEYEEPYST